MKVRQTPSFQRVYKKLRKRDLALVNEAIEVLVKNPEIGEIKRGDLADFRVYKFRDKSRELLLAYNYEPMTGIELVDLGSHENFYRDLKRKF